MDKQPAIFLDRDGVIIENRANYVRSGDDVDIYPQALRALAAIRHSPYKIISVTNQSAVGRGIISLAAAQAINERLLQIIAAANGRIDDVFMCPHAPDEQCSCRKPQPGLLRQAAVRHNLNLSQSYMIIEAAKNEKLKHSIAVMHPENEAMQKLYGKVGFPARVKNAETGMYENRRVFSFYSLSSVLFHDPIPFRF